MQLFWPVRGILFESQMFAGVPAIARNYILDKPSGICDNFLTKSSPIKAWRLTVFGAENEPERTSKELLKCRRSPRVPRKAALAERRCLSALRRRGRIVSSRCKSGRENSCAPRRLEVRMPQAIHRNRWHDLRGQSHPASQVAHGNSSSLRVQERYEFTSNTPDAWRDL